MMFKLVKVLLYNFSAILLLSLTQAEDQCDIETAECLADAANKFIQKYKDGAPSICFPPLDPFRVGKTHFIIEAATNGPRFYYEYDLDDVIIRNFSKSNVITVEPAGRDNPSEPDSYVVITTSNEMMVTGQYELHGVYGTKDIFGEGNFKFQIDNLACIRIFHVENGTQIVNSHMSCKGKSHRLFLSSYHVDGIPKGKLSSTDNYLTFFGQGIYDAIVKKEAKVLQRYIDNKNINLDLGEFLETTEKALAYA